MSHHSHPLTAILDPLNKSESRNPNSRWSVSSTGGGMLELELPVYSRILHDAALSDGVGESVGGYLNSFGVPWMDSKIPLAATLSKRIVPIHNSESIDSDRFVNASAIQFQLYGLPFDSPPAHKFVRWKPSLPVELYALEQFADKVEAVRQMALSKLPIGAAIVANEATVYEDVRYLLDSGVDWIELIQSACFDFTATSHLVFAELQATVSRAIKARTDAKQNCPIWVTGHFTSIQDWSHWLSLGVNACCVDGYLVTRRPVSQTPRDTLAGIRVQTTPSIQFEWLAEVMRDMRTTMIDELTFRNWL
ncbi:MAG: hypothetical protein ACK5OC_20050 [Pirellula sp.]